MPTIHKHNNSKTDSHALISHQTFCNKTEEYLFAAGEIDKIQFSAEFLLRFRIFLLDGDQENGVTSRRMLVHIFTTTRHFSMTT